MANRTFDRPWVLGKGRVYIEGRFRPNGAGAVDNSLNVGAGFTVTRTGVGVYNIVFADSYQTVTASTFGVELAVAVETHVIHTGAPLTSNTTVTITVMQAGAAVDIASGANNWIHFSFALDNSGVTP